MTVSLRMHRFALAFVLLLVVALLPTSTSADHAWGNYHWARTSNPFSLELGDNVDSTWDGHLGTASSDWSKSSVLDTVVAAGQTRPRQCRPTDGRVEVCNDTYGNTGWLGVAQIWTSGNHIGKAIAKMNDTYFNSEPYNTPEWRLFVMCQEVGHTFGLDHQDENFDNKNLGTCMDYTNDPSTNQHPNQHDYDMLETIYGHLDDTSTVGSSTGSGKGGNKADLNHPSEWGQAVRAEASTGKPILFVRDLGRGQKVFTFVTWAAE